VQIVLKDESDIDPNDQNSILEHLDKVVRNLIEKASKKAVNRSEIKLPLVRIKVTCFQVFFKLLQILATLI
jgi:double-strand break repair protein MRE11